MFYEILKDFLRKREKIMEEKDRYEGVLKPTKKFKSENKPHPGDDREMPAKPGGEQPQKARRINGQSRADYQAGDILTKKDEDSYKQALESTKKQVGYQKPTDGLK